MEMEQRGRNRWQRLGSPNAEKWLELTRDRCHRLPPVAVLIMEQRGRNGWQRFGSPEAPKWLHCRETVATGCHRLPFGSHWLRRGLRFESGRGLLRKPRKGGLLLSSCIALRPACSGMEQILETARRKRPRFRCLSRHQSSGRIEDAIRGVGRRLALAAGTGPGLVAQRPQPPEPAGRIPLTFAGVAAVFGGWLGFALVAGLSAPACATAGRAGT